MCITERTVKSLIENFLCNLEMQSFLLWPIPSPPLAPSDICPVKQGWHIRENRGGLGHSSNSGFWPDEKKKKSGPPARAERLKIFTQDLDQSVTVRPQAPFQSAGSGQLLPGPGPRF